MKLRIFDSNFSSPYFEADVRYKSGIRIQERYSTKEEAISAVMWLKELYPDDEVEGAFVKHFDEDRCNDYDIDI